MSTRVHSNIALPPDRWLPKIFDVTGEVPGNVCAIGLVNPNNLPGGPKVYDSMGRSRDNGLVSFFHDNATSTAFTCFYWSSLANKMNPAAGWVHLGNASAIYTQTVDQFSLGTFAVPESCHIYIMATTNPIVNFALAGALHVPGMGSAPDIPYII
jgi:hypothetical protein